jgi:hypothetical protein
MKSRLRIALAWMLATGVILAAASSAGAASSVVISQVYPGGGESGAPYKNDFVELFNESSSPVSLSSYSIQYDISPADQLWLKTNLSGSIAAHSYYLVQEGSGGSAGTGLPSPDATGTINLAKPRGSVIVLPTQTLTTGQFCPLYNPNTSDLVGYGKQGFPYCAESGNSNTTQAPTPSATKADLRRLGGCIDTDSNVADFITGVPDPRNSAHAASTCAKEKSKTTLKVKTTGGKVKTSGSVKPNERGQGVTVTLLRKSGSKFKPLIKTAATLNASSKYAASIAEPKSGTCEVTAKFAGSSDAKPSSAKTRPFSC